MKKVLIIGLVMVLLMSTLVSAGFLTWIKSVFIGDLTGFAVLNEGCDTDRECDGSLICDWISPTGGKKGSCVEFPDDKKAECQDKTDVVIAKLGLIKERLKSVEARSHA